MNQAFRYVVFSGLMLCWLASPTDAASWSIELSNGRQITAAHVWEEGEELKFVTAHGTAGVSKALVKRVTTSAQDATPEHRIRQAAGLDSPPQSTTKEGMMPSQEGTAQADREQKLALTTQLEDARKRLLEATRARNSDAEQGALKDMRAISQQIYALADAVKAKHGGVLPAWWNK